MHYIKILFIGAVFGSVAMFFKIITSEISVLSTIFFRLLFAAIILSAFCFVKNIKIFHPKKWRLSLCYGVLNFTIPLMLFCYASSLLDSSVASVLSSLFPIFTIIFASVLLKEKFQKFEWFGALLCLCGIVFLSMKNGLQIEIKSILPTFAILCANCCYVFSAFFIKTKCRKISAISNLTSSLIFSCIILSPTVFFEKNISGLLSFKVLLPLLYLGLFSTIFAYLFQISLLNSHGAVFTSNASFVAPIFGTIYGVTIMGDVFTVQRFFGFAMILLGLAFILKMNHHIEALTKKFKQKYKLKKL